MKISVTIITLNEEAKIADAIRSVDWADEVVLVDAGSADRTRDIAEELGARVLQRTWTGFSDQKQFAAESAANDLILSLDADERVSPELAKEILALNENGSRTTLADGYRVPRLSIYMGREIRHTSWYPDRQLRLYDRRKGRWNGRVIHESVEMTENAAVRNLDGDIVHRSVSGPREHARMIAERYAPLAAEQMFDAGITTFYPKVVLSGVVAFVRDYVLRAGILDGLPGLCISILSGYAASLKHMILLEMCSTHYRNDQSVSK